VPLYNPPTAAGSDSPSFALSNIMGTCDPREVTSIFVFGANQGICVRVEAPRSGTLVDLSIYVGTSAGNISVAVYDTATAATWTRLYTTGAMACPASNGWRICGSPNLAVTKGAQYYFFLSCDTASAGFGRATALGSTNVADTIPANFLSASAAFIVGYNASLHPAPATITSVAGQSIIPAIIGRIT
jgi:hypothetical protein